MAISSKHVINELLSMADVQINGSRPWDLQVHDERLFKRVISHHSLGLGEAYMDGWWSAEQLDAFIAKVLGAKLDEKLKKNLKLAGQAILANVVNFQTKTLSKKVADVHYNLDNHLYGMMLGRTMSYTCAYWKRAKTLDTAQDHKHDLICNKLNLQPGDKVLELGCGWGGFAEHAAKKYGVEMTSINISKEQVKYGRQRCKDLPVTFHLCDYRDIHTYNPKGKVFDKVVSIGMCEHVGWRNYRTFMEIAAKQLSDHGLFLLHTIGGNHVKNTIEPWHGKYIFPHGMLPAAQQLAAAIQGLFIMEDWHNFGAYYDKTLMAWYDNFTANWDVLSKQYDERFYRMWSYYLQSCAGMFRARDAQLWQLVMSKDGVLGGYNSVR